MSNFNSELPRDWLLYKGKAVLFRERLCERMRVSINKAIFEAITFFLLLLREDYRIISQALIPSVAFFQRPPLRFCSKKFDFL